jgi:hypothetical protein
MTKFSDAIGGYFPLYLSIKDMALRQWNSLLKKSLIFLTRLRGGKLKT